MTESKQKAVELADKFTYYEDAIQCAEEIITELSKVHYRTDVNDILCFWQEVLTHLKEML